MAIYGFEGVFLFGVPSFGPEVPVFDAPVSHTTI